MSNNFIVPVAWGLHSESFIKIELCGLTVCLFVLTQSFAIVTLTELAGNGVSSAT